MVLTPSEKNLTSTAAIIAFRLASAVFRGLLHRNCDHWLLKAIVIARLSGQWCA